MAIKIEKLDEGNNSRYRIRVWARNPDAFGNRKTKQITTKRTTVNVANQMAKILEDEVSQDYSCDIKLIDLFDEYVKIRGRYMSITTQSSLPSYRPYFAEYFKAIKAKDVNTKVAQGFVDFLYDKPKINRKGTVEKYITYLNATINYGVANDYVEYNRIKKLYYRPEKKFKANVQTPEFVGELLYYLKHNYYNLYIPALLTACMSHRNNEALGEKWSDFHPETNMLEINTGIVQVDNTVYEKDTLKTEESQEVVYLPEFVKNELLEHKKLCAGLDSPYICANPFIGLPSPKYITHQFKKVVRKAFGIEMRFYDLRHSFNQTLVENNFSADQRRMATRNSQETNIKYYTQATAAATKRQMEAVSELIEHNFKPNEKLKSENS